MICASCKAGAAENARWRASRLDEPLGALDLKLARLLHKECTGCCCQHATGEDSLKVLTQGVGA